MRTYTKTLATLCLLLGLTFVAAAQSRLARDTVSVTFRVHLPPGTPSGDQIFWMGSLNSWDPGPDGIGYHPWEKARALHDENSFWEITLRVPRGDTVEYLYTRGSHFSAEERAAHRTIVADRSKMIIDTVRTWHDIPAAGIEESWPRIRLHEASPARLQGNGQAARRTGTILYATDFLLQVYRGYHWNTDVRALPGGLTDTALYALRMSDAPDNTILLLAGKPAGSERWHFYLDRNSDHAFTDDELLFAEPTGADSLFEVSSTVQHDYMIDGRVQTATDTLWIRWYREFPYEGVLYRSSNQPDVPTLVYAMRYELREGVLHLPDASVTFAVRTLRPGHGKGFRAYHDVVVDRNGDGFYDVSKGSEEFIEFRDSFRLGYLEVEVADIDPHGRWVRLRPATEPPPVASSSLPGDEAPSWRGTTLAGEALSSRDLRGKYVLLDFWGIWCGPCLAALPSLKQAAAQFPHLTLIGIVVNDTRQNVKRAVERRSLTWPQVLDPKRSIANRFLVRGIPDPILIGPQGTILERGDRLHEDRLLNTLSEYLK